METKGVTPARQSRAESQEWAKLPGIDGLCRAMKAAVHDVRDRGVKARIDAMKIARDLYRYGAQGDVQAQVAILNLKDDGKRREGRPRQGHRLAMEALAAKSGVSLKTLERWVRDWSAITKLAGFTLTDEKDALSAACGKTAETAAAWFEKIETDDGDGDDDAPPAPSKKIAAEIVAVVRRHFTDKNGHVRLDTSKRLEVMNHANPEMAILGMELNALGKESTHG